MRQRLSYGPSRAIRLVLQQHPDGLSINALASRVSQEPYGVSYNRARRAMRRALEHGSLSTTVNGDLYIPGGSDWW